jgi:hypothetical protein
MASRRRAANLWRALSPAPSRFVALSDALAGLEMVLKAERPMTKCPPSGSPPLRCGFTLDLEIGMAAGSVVDSRLQPPSSDGGSANLKNPFLSIEARCKTARLRFPKPNL